MFQFRADLHIHTVLSPCGDLEMSPSAILATARQKGLDIIGITDHNSTRQARLLRRISVKSGIYVLTGAEVTTREEIHCLTFFEDDGQLEAFQRYLDVHLPNIPNIPEKFGYQVVADARENIVYEEKKLLLSALDQSVEDVEKTVHNLGGIFIPAHIDKSRFSILSQLGFIPPGLKCEAIEISPHITYTSFVRTHTSLAHYPFLQFSDAHYLQDIGKVSTVLEMETLSFPALTEAIRLKRVRLSCK